MSELKEETIGERVARLKGEQADTPTTPPAPQADNNVKEKKYHVYYCTIKSCRMVTEIGRVISFVNGMYVTDQQTEIEYLDKEIALGHDKVSVVAGKEMMTSEELDPMAVLKKKHIAEYLAAQEEQAAKVKAGMLPNSVSAPQLLVPGSTSDIAELSEGSGI